nr:hypothetical protein [Tanacetum cinerariifolium]
MSVPVTADEKTSKKNDVKARSLLLMALHNEHQLTSTFMTAPSTSSTNDVNIANPAYEASTVSSNVNTASPQVSIANFSDNVMYAFMVENPSGSNLLHQDLDQIHEDDLEAMDLRWQISLLSMREKKYFLRTGKKIFINANDTAGNQDGRFRSQDNTRKQGNNEDTSSKAMLAIDGSQITDNSKKGLGYHAVPLPHPLIYNGPTKLDLSYSSLDEFKEPEFKSYGHRDSKLESNINHDKKSDDSKENSDDPFVKQQVSEDTSSFVESPLNVDKEAAFFVDKKIEFVKPKNYDKPVKKSVMYAEMYRSQRPRGNQRN